MSKAKILVRHEARYNKEGDVLGVQRSGLADQVREVQHIYTHKDEHGNTMVMDVNGDLWCARPVHDGNYQFISMG